MVLGLSAVEVLTDPPRFDRNSGSGVVGIVGYINKNFTVNFLGPISSSWVVSSLSGLFSPLVKERTKGTSSPSLLGVRDRFTPPEVSEKFFYTPTDVLPLGLWSECPLYDSRSR